MACAVLNGLLAYFCPNVPMLPTIPSKSGGLFPARINRTFFLLHGAALLGTGFLAGLLLSTAHHAGVFIRIICIGGGACVLLFAFIAMFRSLLMPRLRDIGLHPAWSLLIFVHALSGLLLLALLLIPSDAFVNRRYVL